MPLVHLVNLLQDVWRVLDVVYEDVFSFRDSSIVNNKIMCKVV